jgi:hypothetical protein
VTPDVWYVAGSGLLVGADRRWLLLDDVPDEEFVATLWETIAGSGVDRVLTLLESRYGDRMPSLAMIGAGREIARGSGEVTNDRAGVMLSLGGQAAGQRLPFRGGVVSAALVEIPADFPAGRGLIDGIPDEVLSAVGPDIPVRVRQTTRDAIEAAREPAPGDPYPTGTRASVPEVETTGPIPTATEPTRESPVPVTAPVAAGADLRNTVVRSSTSTGPPQPVPEPEFELLREHTHETVMATYCPQGHVNPPYAPH